MIFCIDSNIIIWGIKGGNNISVGTKLAKYTRNMKIECDDITMTISPKKPDTRWVTLDEKNNIISEGKTPEEAIEQAKKTAKNFTLMFVPLKGNTYIF